MIVGDNGVGPPVAADHLVAIGKAGRRLHRAAPAGEAAIEPPPVDRARPRSAVSAGVGLVGLAGLTSYLLIARYAPEIAGWLGIDWGGVEDTLDYWFPAEA